jgi:starvation-inducible DNA-binding protein
MRSPLSPFELRSDDDRIDEASNLSFPASDPPPWTLGRNLPSESTMFATKIDIPPAMRTKLIELCNARLADAIDLQTQCKQAHWNVKGPDFIGLHELFDKITEDVETYVDLIAEQAVQLGGVAEGTLRSVATRSTLAEYAPKGTGGRDHVDALSSALAAFGKLARQSIGHCAELQAADTADLFTEVSRGVDKWLWFVEAHLQGDR